MLNRRQSAPHKGACADYEQNEWTMPTTKSHATKQKSALKGEGVLPSLSPVPSFSTFMREGRRRERGNGGPLRHTLHSAHGVPVCQC